jgi:hypothetical protein
MAFALCQLTGELTSRMTTWRSLTSGRCAWLSLRQPARRSQQLAGRHKRSIGQIPLDAHSGQHNVTRGVSGHLMFRL